MKIDRKKYKVDVNSKEEAEQFRQILIGLDEDIHNEYYPIRMQLVFNQGWYLSSMCDDRETITIKELVKLLVNQPEYVLTSEDGVKMYEGDDFYIAYNNGSKWAYEDSKCSPFTLDLSSTRVIENVEFNKAFSTKEAAESWIKEQNKPKEIVIRHNDSVTSTITNNKVIITSFDRGHASFILHLHGKAIEEIYAAYKSLQTK